MNKAIIAARQFIPYGESNIGVEEYGRGIIHDTYLVTPGNGADRFILQRLNTSIFLNPQAVMHNLQVVCDHIEKRMQLGNSGIDAAWQMLHAIPARDGRYLFIDADGDFWRALSFIQGAVSLEQISGPAAAREVGRALGTFHLLVSDLDPELLHETLPGFHNVEQYLEHFAAVAVEAGDESEAGRFCQRFIEERQDWAPVLENARRDNLLRLRVIHGDPKITNIMVDRLTGKAVSIIDLDTVMPGLVLYDIGDCLRSCCNPSGEEVTDLAGVLFDPDRCESVLSGYADAAPGVLRHEDFDFLYDAIRLIPFELGLRFYADFLAGDV
ncbi:MAG: aminoglycoside phosphotransferase family protein, partial [Desulfobulbales bacterium]|nr:aminoglycoside phosphotransferase family protein [Desulfobulbales bacterium]